MGTTKHLKYGKCIWEDFLIFINLNTNIHLLLVGTLARSALYTQESQIIYIKDDFT